MGRYNTRETIRESSPAINLAFSRVSGEFKLEEINPIDEEHGILEVEYIKQKCSLVLEKYNVSFCYLFGSYAKGKAKPTSDVDFLISADVRGLEFYGLVEEILKDEIKLYG